MACVPDPDRSSQWSQLLDLDEANPAHSLPIDNYSPSTASTGSSSSPDSDDSVDAPSSQSSVESSDSPSSETDSTPWAPRQPALTISSQSQALPTPISLQDQCDPRPARAVAPEARQHPRRTQRLNSYESQDGQTVVACPRPPPSLVRQSERKENFVDTLVDTTTQMIETIWPLSILSCARDSAISGRQQSLIGLRTFVHEVLRRSKTSYSTLQVALYYLILIQSCLPKHDFTMEQYEDSSACRAMQCGRRMFLAALILASKYLQDRNYSARAWSKISGLRTCEINTNEMAFLQAVKWKLHIPEHVFNRWTNIVLRYSPSANVPTRSFSRPSISWKAIIPTLTPDLDTIPSGPPEISDNCPDDSGYDSPGSNFSDRSPPPSWTTAVALPDPGYDECSAKPLRIQRTLETSSLAKRVDESAVPPLPHLGSLPTPQMTPQTGAFCTPAVSASGLDCGRSMRHAMAQIQENCLARSTLDKPNHWQVNAPKQGPVQHPVIHPISCISSPESMISDTSSQSSRSSRSSSISSVASSNCAMPPPRIALSAQATQRCASKHMSGFAENRKPIPSLNGRSWSNRPGNRTLPPLEPQLLPRADLGEPITLVMPNNKSTGEAAVALRDLHLNHQRPPLPPPAVTLRPQKQNKRARPNSMDLSLQSCVRDQLAPRCLGDITSMNTGNAEDSIVLPDSKLADSFLVPKKENSRPSSSHANIKPTLSAECLPRKRTCAGSDRGGRAEARLFMQQCKDVENDMQWAPQPLYGEVIVI